MPKVRASQEEIEDGLGSDYHVYKHYADTLYDDHYYLDEGYITSKEGLCHSPDVVYAEQLREIDDMMEDAEEERREADRRREFGSCYEPDEEYSGPTPLDDMADEPFTEDEREAMYWAAENAEALRSIRRADQTESK